MKKNISHEEKLEFYKDFNKKENLNNFQKLDSFFHPLIYVTYNIVALLASILIIGGFFLPELFLGLLPTFAALPVAKTILNIKKNKLIKSINDKFSYKDYLNMQKTGEWTSFVHELNKTEQDEKIETLKAVQNIPRHLSCCIFSEEDFKVKNDKNLLQKSIEKSKEQTVQNTSRTLYCNILEDKNEQITENNI